MEKNVVTGIQNKKPMKKNKKKWLRKVLDYVKSDSYMFGPLIFDPTDSPAAPGFHFSHSLIFNFFFLFVNVFLENWFSSTVLLWFRGGNDKTQ